MEDEIYACPCCGHEAHADAFGRYCPKCHVDLDEVEREFAFEVADHNQGGTPL